MYTHTHIIYIVRSSWLTQYMASAKEQWDLGSIVPDDSNASKHGYNRSLFGTISSLIWMTVITNMHYWLSNVNHIRETTGLMIMNKPTACILLYSTNVQ